MRMQDKVRKLVLLFAVAVLVVGGMGAPVSAQSANKQIDKLISRAGDMVDAMAAARLQIGTTVDDYNGIIGGEMDDNRAAYKELQKALKKSEKSATSVVSEVQKMQEAADTYFASWESSMAEFSSDEMRQRSEQRMNDTRERYDGILTAGRETGDAFAPFVTQLKDQILFLGYDLNPSAIADLKGDAEKLNGQAKDVFEGVDATIETAEGYRDSLRPD